MIQASSPSRDSPPHAAAPAGYLELIRRNPNFRRLWIAEIVSLLGDWFNTIALYHLVATLTGTEWLLLMAADTVSILAASAILERGWLDLRGTAVWFATVVPAERRAGDVAYNGR